MGMPLVVKTILAPSFGASAASFVGIEVFLPSCTAVLRDAACLVAHPVIKRIDANAAQADRVKVVLVVRMSLVW
jgi:hypothetical protein